MPEPQLLITFLADRDLPCPICHYNLRGVIEARCPECGSTIALGISSPQSHIGPWLLATIAFALAIGFDFVATLLAFIPLVRFGPPAYSAAPQLWNGLITVIVLGVASTVGLFILVHSRARWQRRPIAAQWVRAGLTFLLVFLVHALAGVLAVL